jgi:hypothetical protein
MDGEVCPTCGSANKCGMEKGDATCWCFALPHVLPVSATEKSGCCLCRGCLTLVTDSWTTSADAGPERAPA